MAEIKNYFKELNSINVNEHTESKNGLTYLSWAWAWGELKKRYPDAFYTVYENKDGWNYFHDGGTCWVKTGVTINGIEHIEELPIMDFKNKSIVASNITSSDANKAIQRSLTKACARHGLGLYIYEGEDLPEETKEVSSLQSEIMDIIKKKSVLSDEAKEKVAKTCKEADDNANGDPRLIEDVETLRTLKKKLMAIRK